MFFSILTYGIYKDRAFKGKIIFFKKLCVIPTKFDIAFVLQNLKYCKTLNTAFE